MPAPTASALKKNRPSNKTAPTEKVISITPTGPSAVSTALFETAWMSAGVQRISATKVTHCTIRNAVHHVIAIQSKNESSASSAMAATSSTNNAMAQCRAPGAAAPNISQRSRLSNDRTARNARRECSLVASSAVPTRMPMHIQRAPAGYAEPRGTNHSAASAHTTSNPLGKKSCRKARLARINKLHQHIAAHVVRASNRRGATDVLGKNI